MFDAGTQSRFGAVQLDGEQAHGTQVSVRLRTGETQTPDDTWRAWSKELAVGQSLPELAPGRFVQAKLILHGDGVQTPTARRVRIAFIRENLTPFVGEVVVLPKGVVLQPLPVDQVHERTLVINDKGFADLKQHPADADAGRRPANSRFLARSPSPGSAKIRTAIRCSTICTFCADGGKDFRLLKADLPIPFLLTQSVRASPMGAINFVSSRVTTKPIRRVKASTIHATARGTRSTTRRRKSADCPCKSSI